MVDKRLTIDSLYKECVEALKGAGVENPSLDARLIVMRTLGMSDVDFITEAHSRVVACEERDSVQENIKKRCGAMPVSKIFGEKEFWGLSFFVNEHCLDPRPDTETLIESVLQSFGVRKHDPLRIVDFGTGSGCIIISLLREFPNAYGVAVDISIDALKVAKKNAEDLGVSDRISFVCSSWNDSILVNGEACFDVVVSNPPYIESNVIHDLQDEVIHFDPLLALDGGEKGLNPYEFLIPELKFLLKKTGKAFFEIGKGQEVEIERLIEKSDATLSRLSRDMAGIIRVVDISCGDK